jgi:hypothetical protein
MGLPTESVTLTPEQIVQLNNKLAHMRHDINNHISLIAAAVELLRHKPQLAERMMTTIAEQPPRITETINQFSAEFAQTFGLSRSIKEKNL